jgi:threonine dehydratase
MTRSNFLQTACLKGQQRFWCGRSEMKVASEVERKVEAAVTLRDIRSAHARIAPRIHRTPVMTSRALDEIAGSSLFFKCENLQKTGSFKIRGATNAVFSLTDDEAKNGIVAPSSGNHAAAVAQAARWRGIPAYIVMPSNSSEAKKEAVRFYGGEITECDPNVAAREAAAAKIIARTGAHLVHPYNDARVIAGQGTAAIELIEEVPDLDIVMTPASGGGLLSGTSIAAHGLNPAIRVVGGEPLNADDAYRSLQSGRIEDAAASSETMADGLRATLCPLTFSILREHVAEICRVSEDEIVESMRMIWERMKIVVEASGAVAAGPALFRKVAGGQGKKIGIILSGGNIDLRKLPFGVGAGR